MEEKCQQVLRFYEEDYLWRKKQTENDVVIWMVHQLSQEELRLAAERSYAYWWLYCRENPCKAPSSFVTAATALREAARHFEGIETKERALQLLKETLKFHQQQQTHLFRTCFAKSASPSDRARQVHLQQQIENEMENLQTFCIRGRDKEGHAILFAFPRKQTGTLDASFTNTVQYAMERAIACTEFTTMGRHNKVVVVLDTSKSAAPPSVNAAKQCVQLLQTYYPGRLLKLIILNPPFLLLTLHKLVKPFLDPETAGKFLFVKGDQQKLNVLGELIHPDQAMPVMLPGRGKLTEPVHYKRFLYQASFHSLYDESDDPVNERPNATAAIDATERCAVSVRSLARGSIVLPSLSQEEAQPIVILLRA